MRGRRRRPPRGSGVPTPRTRVLIIGGGSVGTEVARRLRRRLRGRAVEVAVVNPESFMQYQPFLPEVASGSIEPRHVVVPLRRALPGVRVITGEVVALDHERRRATIRPIAGDPYDIAYDVVVVAPGSVSRVLPIPGLDRAGIGFKTVAEAIHLRNRVLRSLDVAESTAEEDVRRRSLTFVFVGGGYAGIEAMAELEDMAARAMRYYGSIRKKDMRWVLVEAAGRILPELDEGLAAYALEQLHRRGFLIHLGTRLESAADGEVVLSDGARYGSDTVVWTAGVRPHPLVGHLGFPVEERGRVVTDEFLRVRGVRGAWAAGDGAAVPDLVNGGFCPPTAQYGMRQARRLAENLAAAIHGGAPRPFRHPNLGSLATLGLYKGVARVLGLHLRGVPAWALHRAYHLGKLPTLDRKVRVIADWTAALLFRGDVVQLGSLEHPRGDFTRAFTAGDAGGTTPPPAG